MVGEGEQSFSVSHLPSYSLLSLSLSIYLSLSPSLPPSLPLSLSPPPPPPPPPLSPVVSLSPSLSLSQPSQVGSLFTFMARQGAKHRTSIRVDESIYDQVLNYITHTEEDIVNEERQQVHNNSISAVHACTHVHACLCAYMYMCIYVLCVCSQ